MIASRIKIAPVIDGIIDDEPWKNTIPQNEFLQWEPYNLSLPSQNTEVRIAYDNDNVYVAVKCYDNQPKKIIGRLSRRDNYEEAFANHSDWVAVCFDSNNDDRTGYLFGVNAAGSIMDVFVSGEGMNAFDNSWEAVWEYKQAVHSEGWSIELKIPMSVFNFDSKSNEDWGIQIIRFMHRYQEEVHWPGRMKGVSGFVPYYGILKGMENIPSPKKFEFLPYGLGGITNNNSISSTGIDMKYGLNAKTSLNISINPDFGQVEADPSVLNLTAFETQFEEKRPFFIEGGSFFKNRYQLFHSRRIGQTPGILIPEESVPVKRPDATTILGAGKLLGETVSGTKYGFIEAITDEEYGTWETENGDTVSGIIEPKTNYFIGRFEKPVFNSFSTVGFMTTDVRRNRAGYSNVIGLDWKLKFIENALTFKGQIVQTNKDKITGNGVRFNLGYLDPNWWEINFVTGYTNDRYEINDLGYNERNNKWYYGSYGEFRKQDPWGKFLDNNLEYRVFVNGTISDGIILSKVLELEQKNRLKNYWSFGWDLEINFASFNDEDTFRDERAWVYKSETEGDLGLWLRTDRRKKLIIAHNSSIGRGEYSNWRYRAWTMIQWRPLENANMTIVSTQKLGSQSMEWVDIVDDSSSLNIIYAESESKLNDIQLRFNWTFTPDLTFEVFYQPFTVNMNYINFYRLVKENTRILESCNYITDPDFKINNSVGTFVLRWEYNPGSTLYLVYNLNSNEYYSAEDDTWEINNADSFFIKFNYWLKI
tara:strand:- start:17636 stop:19918 length:2283 start_codon:yes stop_codon:yes gene_type:complete